MFLDLLVTGSWDGFLNMWDIRMQGAKVQSLKQAGKVFALDVGRANTVLVATSQRRLSLYDIRQMNTPTEERESPLKYQTRDAALFPDDKGYCLTSTEGRVAVEFLGDAGLKGFTFKCHRQKLDDKTLVFPVNSVAFHPM